MPDIQEFDVVAIPGETTMVFPQDFALPIRFVDPINHSIVIADFTGVRALKASQILPMLTAAQLSDLLNQIAPDLLWQLALAQGANPGG